jgi:hypothetical protein
MFIIVFCIGFAFGKQSTPEREQASVPATDLKKFIDDYDTIIIGRIKEISVGGSEDTVRK